MKKIRSVLILSWFVAGNSYGQKSPADFGRMAFWCFQHNRLDSLFKSIPTLADLSGFAKELGIAEGTEAYSSFIKRYPLVIKSFKDKCYQIQRDSLDCKFSWTNAKFDKMEQVEKTVSAENIPTKNIVVITGLSIYFTSMRQSYLMNFGDLHRYGGVWKPGNNLTLTIQYK